MKKLTLFFVLVISLLYVAPATAQNYKTAVGLRLGYPVSVSGKMFLGESGAVEAFVGTRGYTFTRSTNVSVAYLIHKPLEISDDLEGLSYYYGGGLNAYFWSYKNNYIGDDGDLSFGVSAYIGLDYTFEDIPLSITVDWGPSFLFNGYLNGFGGRYGGAGVRYILNRGE